MSLRAPVAVGGGVVLDPPVVAPLPPVVVDAVNVPTVAPPPPTLCKIALTEVEDAKLAAEVDAIACVLVADVEVTAWPVEEAAAAAAAFAAAVADADVLAEKVLA